MRFGSREICNVVFKSKKNGLKIGGSTFAKGQPILYIDTATAANFEQSVTTVYAQGGRGNTRLITWDGEKTLTFTVTDALLSPAGLSILANAGILQAGEDETVQVHTTSMIDCETDKELDLSDILYKEDDSVKETISTNAPIFIMKTDRGSIGEALSGDIEVSKNAKLTNTNLESGKTYFVDFYVAAKSTTSQEIQITPDTFGNDFYVEASTLFRDESDGHDFPAEIVIPKAHIQSNFTLSMSASGDPSTFDFVMDAMPDYTIFNHSKKVLCAIQTYDVDRASSNTSMVLKGALVDEDITNNAKAATSGGST